MKFLWHLERQNRKHLLSLRTNIVPWPGCSNTTVSSLSTSFLCRSLGALRVTHITRTRTYETRLDLHPRVVGGVVEGRERGGGRGGRETSEVETSLASFCGVGVSSGSVPAQGGLRCARRGVRTGGAREGGIPTCDSTLRRRSTNFKLFESGRLFVVWPLRLISSCDCRRALGL